MSVRKLYSVLVNGEVVYSGTIASCRIVFSALNKAFKMFDFPRGPVVLIAFKP